MTMADVTFATIHVTNGKDLGDTPQVAAHPSGKRTSRGDETMILFLDLQNADPAALSEVSRIFTDGYWRAPGGLTTAMRLAMKLANDRVVDLNRGVPPSQRVLGSISCAVINDENVIIAQSGPAIAFACAQTGAFERLNPEINSPPVGSSRTTDANFTNFAWKTGDSFVLTGHGSYTSVSDELIHACMRKGDGKLIAGYINANVKQGKMAGVAFSVAGQPGKESAVALAPAGVADAQAATAGTSLLRQQAQSNPAPMVGHSVPEPMVLQTAAEPARSAPSVLSGASASATAFIGDAAKTLQRGMGAFGKQLLPASAAQALTAQRSRVATFGLASIAILLPIIVALIVTILYFQFSGEAEKAQLRGQIQQQVELAKAAPSIDKWTKALALIDSFEDKYPQDMPSLLEEHKLVQSQVDQVNKTTRVVATSIVDLPQTAAPRRIAAASLYIYALDPSTNRAEYYTLNVQYNGVSDKPFPLALAGATLPAGVQISDITYAMSSNGRWHAEGAVMYSRNALYEFNSATGQMIPLNLPTDPASTPDTIVAGDLYNGSSYLLDTGIGQIWRYTWQGNKLVRGDPYFRPSNPQVKDAIDIAIDGAVYLLKKDGTVLKFYGRKAMPFNVNAASLPQPIGEVVAIDISGPDQNTGNVYIGDTANGAIWQFSKTGEYLRQYRATNNEFVGMQDMSLDPTSNTMYVNTPSKLYSFKVG